jgi:hypothetical protein
MLGSAFMSLWQQTKLRVSPVGVTLVTVYLLGTFTLHITIPGMLQVTPFTAIVSTSYPTMLSNVSYEFK